MEPATPDGTARLLSSVEPGCQIAGFELELRLTRVGRPPDGCELLRVSAKVRVRGTGMVEPLSLLLERVMVERGVGERAKREYKGSTLHLLSYLSHEPHQGARIAADGTALLCATMSFATLDEDDERIVVTFREDLADEISLLSVEVHALPIARAPLLRLGGQRTCLVPRSEHVTGLRDVRVLRGVVWRARGCSKDDVRVVLRDSSGTDVCSGLDWVAYDLGNDGHVLASFVPFLEAKDLQLCMSTTRDSVLRNLEIEWALVHAPEADGWVMLECAEDAETKIAAMTKQGWGTYLASYIPSWRRLPAAASSSDEPRQGQ